MPDYGEKHKPPPHPALKGAMDEAFDEGNDYAKFNGLIPLLLLRNRKLVLSIL
jgi:hypothetical protein